MRPSPSSYNKQYTYDHRFTGALFIDEEFVKEDEKIIKASMRQTQNLLMQHSGIIGFDVFGEKPFKPENKKECLKFSDVQQKLVKVIQNNFIHTREKYHPRVETSFTVIAFPSPEIGPNFKEIFSEILEVNMLDPIKYQKIQQIMIDVLDQADFVHVKGKGKNKTNIKVKMQEIQDPSSQTIFENCGADINIPVGEVFTTPHLRGTNGILHVEESYLRDIKYDNIVFTFKDGYIDDYTCSNIYDVTSLRTPNSKNGTTRLYYREHDCDGSGKDYSVISITPLYNHVIWDHTGYLGLDDTSGEILIVSDSSIVDYYIK